jgi:integrase
LTFADILPTLGDMNAIHPLKKAAKAETVSVGNVTVRIYKRSRRTASGKSRTIFEVADYSGGARRLRGFGDHRAALDEADKIARQIASGNNTAATMLNSEAASYGRAVQLLRPTGATLELACAVYAKAYEILGKDNIIEAATFYARHRGDQITTATVARVVEELIEAKKARGKSARYVGDLSSRLTRFAEGHAVDISTVTTADVQRWLDSRKQAPQTARNFRTVLYTLFSFAEARGYIFKGGNPVAGTENITTKGGGAIQIYTPAEMAALLNAAPREFLPFVALGGFAGLRTAEIERLDWSDLDMAGGFIQVAAEKAKTRSRRLVPVLPNLVQWLADYAQEKGKVWKGKLNSLKEARAETVEKAATSWKDNALRHSFISYRLAGTQNAAQVALEAGNSPSMVFKHYRELVKPETAKAWFAIAPKVAANIVPMAKEGAA